MNCPKDKTELKRGEYKMRHVHMSVLYCPTCGYVKSARSIRRKDDK